MLTPVSRIIPHGNLSIENGWEPEDVDERGLYKSIENTIWVFVTLLLLGTRLYRQKRQKLAGLYNKSP